VLIIIDVNNNFLIAIPHVLNIGPGFINACSGQVISYKKNRPLRAKEKV